MAGDADDAARDQIVEKLRAWKMKSELHETWESRSPKATQLISTTGWTVILGGFTAIIFLLLAGPPSVLRSSLVVEPQPGCSCQTAKDVTQSSSPPTLPSHLSSNDSPPIFSPPVQKLLDELKQARKQVAESDDQSYTQEENAAWASEHPCRARTELPPIYASRKVVADAPPNPQWEAVFEEYSLLHRACLRKVGKDNIVAVFNERRVIPGCKFMTGESLYGLGNKVTYAASVLLYAVITKRVVLFPHSTAPRIMCEPFEGSFWTLPPDLEYLNRRAQANGINFGIDSNATGSFLAWVDAAQATATVNSSANGTVNGAQADKGLFYAEADDGWHPVNRFYCDTEQTFLSRVQWLSAAGCLYFLPKLYTIPSIRPTLEALFPKPGLTLTYVVRAAFLPGDEAWDRVQRTYAMHLENADRRVSIQARYRGGQEEHDKYSPHVNAHITKCLQENEILPNVTDFSTAQMKVDRSSARKFPIVKVMITSLYTDIHDHLNELYLRHSTVTGESVGLVQITHENEQGFGREVDLQALVEIFCLSLSDVILTTPLSTFGGTAQVYGALTPWLIEFNDQEQGSCVQSPSVDLCYQLDEAHSLLSCPYDPAVNGSHVLEAASYIHTCSPMESETGILLLST